MFPCGSVLSCCEPFFLGFAILGEGIMFGHFGKNWFRTPSAVDGVNDIG